MNEGWNAEEARRLRVLRLDPVQNTRDKLEGLVNHFKRPHPSVFAVTEGTKKPHVSKALAQKVRDLTREGKLDWLTAGG